MEPQMNTLQSLEGIMMFAAYFASSVALLALFTRLYLWVTPYDEGKDISKGKMAPAIALGGAMLGFTFPLLIASYSHRGFVEFVAWSVIACLVQLLVFGVLHRFLPRVIETNNPAGAVCFAVASVCAGLINAASFVP
jgi:putative membrane protein